MWRTELEKKVFGVTYKTIEILTKLGKVYVGEINNLTEELNKLELLGYSCHLEEEYIVLDEETINYVVRKRLNVTEQVFEGTLFDALREQENWKTEEEDLITIEDISSFDDLMMKNYFGDDQYFYEVVTKEEYEKAI
jgi:hypothetical protein